MEDDDIEEIPTSDVSNKQSQPSRVEEDEHLAQSLRTHRLRWKKGETGAENASAVELKTFPQKENLTVGPPQRKPRRQSLFEENDGDDDELRRVFSRNENETDGLDASMGGDPLDDSTQSQQDQDDFRSASRLSRSMDLDLSIRDKIRDKFRTALAKAETKERFTRRFSVAPREKSFKIEPPEENEEEKLEQALNRSFELRDKLQAKVSTKPKPVQQIMPTAEEQYDFFTKVYDEPPKPPKLTPSSSRPEMLPGQEVPGVISGEIEGQPEITEETKLLEHLADEEAWNLTVMARPFALSEFDQLKREAQLYFTPTFLPVSALKKTGRTDVRRVEEEGLYTGPELDIPLRNVNTMEQRLLRQPDKGVGWFGSDGKILKLPSSLAHFPSKPDFTEDDPKLETLYCKAVPSRKGAAHTTESYQLDVDVLKLMFTHHSLFSKENVLVMRLMQQYKNYLQRTEENMADYYRHKLIAVKSSLGHVEEQILLYKEGEAVIPDDLMIKLNSLKTETRELRRMKNNEEVTNRQLLQNILKTWKSIKGLRHQQNYSATSMQLFLKRHDINVKADRSQWENDLIEDLKEREEDYMEWYYKQIAAINERKEEETEAEFEIPPPFNKDVAYQELQEIALRTRRNPGEPVYSPVIGSSGSITPIDQCPPGEKERRQQIARSRLFAKVYFNDLEVCSTPVRPLNSDFCLTFGQMYNLHVYEWPRGIKIKIFESEGIVWNDVATIYLPVPKITQITTPGIVKMDEIEFSNSNQMTHNHAGVGAGIPFNIGLEGVPSVILNTSGVLQCSALWGRAKDGTPLVPPPRSGADISDEISKIALSNVAALEELQTMLKSFKFDPNNPENAKIYSAVKDVEAFSTGKSKQLECFRLEPAECQLISEEEFQRNPRFRLLQLRNEQVPEFRNMKMIPANAKEISPDIFKNYDQRRHKEREKVELSDLDAYRQAVSSYLAAMRAQVVDRLFLAQKTKSFQDIVNEQDLPSLGALGLLLFEDPGRPLKPARRERKKITGQNFAGVEVRLLVNIVRAFNVPVRTADRLTLAQKPESTQKLVEPFVEITFQGRTARTSVLHGINPTWNQQLFLTFVAPNDDYSASNLQTVTDTVYFNLYDQIVTELPKDNRDSESTVHQQIEKRWLGTMKIPFSTIYYNGRISGSFRLKVPPILLSYSVRPSVKDQKATNVVEPHLQMFIAIEPPLIPPEPIRGRFESIEGEVLQQYGEQWLTAVQSTFPQRRVVPFVIDTNGRSVFISRFLRAIRPPPEVEAISADKKAASDLACRIVSMIPFISDPVLFPGMCDIWSTCDQFLGMLCGDEEEHAVLLWCWLMGIGVPSYLLLGNGLPEGPRASYVFVKLPSSSVLYNASDGTGYALSDSLCPLLSIGCAVSAENIWANVQQAQQPSGMSFDFEKVSDWKPFFTKAYPNPGLVSIQPDALQYIETSRESILELQEKVERSIREKFITWRPRMITRWNRFVSATLRELLQTLESESNATEALEEKHSQALQTVLETYKISGFPLNQGYVTTENIVETVYATNVYNNLNPDVEFALAVHVYPYSNSILSVWVYIASLIRRR